ncbi:polysaccharide biosynthesis protein [Granulosicoccus sp.]|nr:polysaccharide biosynthesis protein [Granulosicoccus sp.]MDB4224521.1 polysaccharide biosynthesis protein [Granulosicoccus sp.]
MNSFLITGGTGSFGKTMLQNLLETTEDEVVILSRDEEKQDSLRNLLRSPRVNYRIGDIRDRKSVDDAMRGVSHVFHAAALKQVPSCEFFPLQAMKTNIEGSANVIESAIAHGVKSVVCLSTDKAVFPINAMGMSKAMMEKTAQASARELGSECVTRISCVRYGNVMCSRGSVIPLFMRQIGEGRPITITVPEMTRFLMPLSESVSLVRYAFENARQGDLFIKKAAASTIADLLSAIKNIMGKPNHPVETIGWRHGEKLYETLASSQELSTAEDLGDYWRLQTDLRRLDYKPYFSEGDQSKSVHDDFHSHNTQQLTISEIEALLLSLPDVREMLNIYRG